MLGEPLAVPVQRDVVLASGPDAETFLQGQLSQDIGPLEPGNSVWSFLLQPAGKVDAWLRVTRLADDAFQLDVDGGFGDAVIERLSRFKLRTKCDLAQPLQHCLAVRGAGSDDVIVPDGPGARLPIVWPGVPGFDVLTEHPVGLQGLRDGTVAEYEGLRIAAGVPAMGAELSGRTIPAEVGDWIVEASISFTKGCFTGQELVARIDSRGGNVPRRLRAVVFDAPQPAPPVGADVLAGDGKAVGELTSVGTPPGQRGVVALAYIGRAVAPPADVTVTWTDGEMPARVAALPLEQ